MEPRRIELTTVTPKEDVEDEKKSPPSLRFRMQLGETTEKSCPEFSYTELMKNALVSLEFCAEFTQKLFPNHFPFILCNFLQLTIFWNVVT